MRVLISAGGTAGHVLPALAVLKALKAMTPPKSSAAMSGSKAASSNGADFPPPAGGQGIQALFVGEQDGMERELARRDGVDFTAIHAGAVHGVGLRRAARGILRLAMGTVKALRIIGGFRPDVVLLTGGFVGVPVSAAAWLRRVPSVVYLPDIEPGLALKAMARLARRVATTTEASAPYIPASKMVVTGYPVRDAFRGVTRESARAGMGIPADAEVVLAFGGSKGARSINRAVLAALPHFMSRSGLVLIQVTGSADWPEVQAAREALPDAQQARYLAFPYLHEDMAEAMAAADLVVCRSGASTLGELPALGLPAVLVPYPHAWRYQKVNARYLAERGAAVMIEDAQLNEASGGLWQAVAGLLDDPARLGAMREAARRLGGRDGAREIAEVVLRVARHDGR